MNVHVNFPRHHSSLVVGLSPEQIYVSDLMNEITKRKKQQVRLYHDNRLLFPQTLIQDLVKDGNIRVQASLFPSTIVVLHDASILNRSRCSNCMYIKTLQEVVKLLAASDPEATCDSFNVLADFKVEWQVYYNSVPSGKNVEAAPPPAKAAFYFHDYLSDFGAHIQECGNKSDSIYTKMNIKLDDLKHGSDDELLDKVVVLLASHGDLQHNAAELSKKCHTILIDNGSASHPFSQQVGQCSKDVWTRITNTPDVLGTCKAH